MVNIKKLTREELENLYEIRNSDAKSYARELTRLQKVLDKIQKLIKSGGIKICQRKNC